MRYPHWLALFLLLTALGIFILALAWCGWRPDAAEITPTLIISATPSDTPAPPTATVVTLTAQATETAVSPSPPATAVSPSPTSTATATPTPTPTAPPEPSPTAIPLYVVQPGDCLACLSWAWYSTQTKWVDIWEANGKFRKPHLIYPGQELIRPK